MRPAGFSTGSLALGDFRRALQMLAKVNAGITALELSALRESELDPLLDALGTLDLSSYEYVSLHAPSRIETGSEQRIRERLMEVDPAVLIVLHPDAVGRLSDWKPFGRRLCVENMDKREPSGRTAAELEEVFRQVPEASFCFDIGHARQVDPTMIEARLILGQFSDRLKQVHVSEVSTASRHHRLSYGATVAFQDVAHLIPENVPLILETPVEESEIAAEVNKVRVALPCPSPVGSGRYGFLAERSPEPVMSA